MGRITIRVAKVLDARPEDVYATIADYHNGHPHIIPEKNLYDLQVEEGGYGAGTIITFKSRFLGQIQEFRQRVSEPEPGRILVEQDIAPGQNESSTFTVTPVEQGEKSHVEIAMGLDARPGLPGRIERLILPRIFPPVFLKELDLLEGVASKRRMSSAV